MSINSISFLGFYLPLLLIVYHNKFVKNNTYIRKIVLLFINISLYAFSEPIYVILLFGIIGLNYILVVISDRTQKMMFRAFSIVIDVLVLLTFKYINSFLLLLNKEDSFYRVLFPIGLSYIIFKSISYVVDSIENGAGSLLDVTIYISNFLTIVSGPLSTYKEELPYIKQEKYNDKIDYYNALERLIIGLAKKIIIADSLDILVSYCFSASELTIMLAWVGAIAFTLQIYYDFSGYTDMVIGIGYLFGFKLPENFNYPYMAKSISDFWKRWHMSLTKWFTKYIYFPLGGAHVNTICRHVFNLFVVWIVTGIWHGSTWTYIIWAMIYFILQLIEKYTKWNDFLNRIHLSRIYTLFFIIVEWVIFKSESVSGAIVYLKSMFKLNYNAIYKSNDFSIIIHYIIPFILGILFSIQIWPKIKAMSEKYLLINIIYNFILVILFVICLILLLGKNYLSPLYAGF